MITENSLRVLLEGWQDLTNKQYDDASKGIGRIDRNGDYHAKREYFGEDVLEEGNVIVSKRFVNSSNNNINLLRLLLLFSTALYLLL